MKLTTVGTVVATRVLDLPRGRKVTVRIGKPRKFRGGEDYCCPFEIRWPDRTQIFGAGGIDAVQALDLGLKMIATRLYTSPEAQTRKLTWRGRHDFGLPVLDSIADLVPKPDTGVKRGARRSSSRTKRKTAP